MNKRKIVVFFVVLSLLHVFFILLPNILYPGSMGGNFGVRPRSNKCIGVVISNEMAKKILPSGDVAFNLLGKGYEYRVYKDRMLHDVCIGQDVWYGE